DRAILELLYATGVRVSELVNINLRDIDFKNKLLRVFGKRRKERIVPFGDPAAKALQDYLGVREKFLMNAPATKRDAQPLILNYQGTRMTTRSVGRLVEKYIRLCRRISECIFRPVVLPNGSSSASLDNSKSMVARRVLSPARSSGIFRALPDNPAKPLRRDLRTGRSVLCAACQKLAAACS